MALEQIADKVVPEWLSLDKEQLIGKVVRPPGRENIEIKIDDKVIVEYYSR
jgi:small subunit ribosomal protein S4